MADVPSVPALFSGVIMAKHYVMSGYSLESISRGIILKVPVRDRKVVLEKRRGRLHRKNQYLHKWTTRHVKGSGIPVKTLQKFLRKKDPWHPSAKTARNIRNTIRRLNYNRLRAAGCSPLQARKQHFKHDVEKRIADYRGFAEIIAHNAETTVEAVTWAMGLSEKSYEYYVENSFISGLKKETETSGEPDDLDSMMEDEDEDAD